MTQLMAKARIAAKSAHALLALGDTNGAVNRAYYAMFGASKAALAHIDEQLAVAKTHATIIRRFGQHVVVDHNLDRSIGRHLNSTEELRIAADYDSNSVDASVAQAVLGRMDDFIAIIEQFLSGTSK